MECPQLQFRQSLDYELNIWGYDTRRIISMLRIRIIQEKR